MASQEIPPWERPGGGGPQASESEPSGLEAIGTAGDAFNEHQAAADRAMRQAAIDEKVERIVEHYEAPIPIDQADAAEADEAWQTKLNKQILWYPQREYAKRSLPRPDFIVPGMLQMGKVGMFVGTGGSGKSTIAVAMCMSVAAWREDINTPAQFIGDFDINPKYRRGGAAYISFEDEPHELMHRAKAWAMRTFGNRGQGFKFLERPDGLQGFAVLNETAEDAGEPLFGIRQDPLASAFNRTPMWTDMGYAHLKAIEERLEIPPSLVVIDPVANAYGGNENDRAQVSAFLTYLIEWARKMHCAVLLLAHPNKAKDSYSGSTTWQGASRSHIELCPLQAKVKEVVEKSDDGKSSDKSSVCVWGHEPNINGGLRSRYWRQQAPIAEANEDGRALKALIVHKLSGGKLPRPMVVEMRVHDRWGQMMIEWTDGQSTPDFHAYKEYGSEKIDASDGAKSYNAVAANYASATHIDPATDAELDAIIGEDD